MSLPVSLGHSLGISLKQRPLFISQAKVPGQITISLTNRMDLKAGLQEVSGPNLFTLLVDTSNDIYHEALIESLRHLIKICIDFVFFYVWYAAYDLFVFAFLEKDEKFITAELPVLVHISLVICLSNSRPFVVLIHEILVSLAQTIVPSLHCECQITIHWISSLPIYLINSTSDFKQ